MNPSCRLFRATLLGFGALLLSQVSLHATDTTKEIKGTDYIIDTWVGNAGGQDVSHADENLLMGGTKEIYLRIKVDAATAGTGKPMDAMLSLVQATGAANIPFDIYAANNRKDGDNVDWLETMEWIDRPLITTKLTSYTTQAPATPGAGRPITLNLGNYISGPGYYTFCIKTTSASDVTFYRSEVATGPMLVFDIDDGLNKNPGMGWDSPYFQLFAKKLEEIGPDYRDRYKASASGNSHHVDNVGYFDVTKQPYGATPNNINSSDDDTLAIQRAVNEARIARVAVYFPAGDYHISDTIQLVQGDNQYGKNPDDYIGDLRWSAHEYPCVLLGSRAAGSRSKIILKGSSAGFGDDTHPKAMLHFWSRETSRAIDPDIFQDKGIDPNKNTANSQYNQILDNIDLHLNGGTNHGAIGIDMDAAQGSNISNSTITAAGAYAGLIGGTGPGGYTYGVTVMNGKYGARLGGALDPTATVPAYVQNEDNRPESAGDPHCPLIVNCRFAGQEVNSISYGGRGPLTLVGVEINGRGIKLEADWDRINNKGNVPNGPIYGNLNIIDSRIQISGASPRLAIEGDRSIALTNVYLLNGVAEPIIKITDPISNATNIYYKLLVDPSQQDVQNPAYHLGWKRIIRLARGVNIDQSTFSLVPNSDATRVNYWLNGISFPTGWHHEEVLGAPLANYSAGNDDNLHAWAQTPDFNDTANVINAKTFDDGNNGNGPDGISEGGTNNAALLNTIISKANAQNKAVFIPRGEYKLENTVYLLANTKLFGIGAAFSNLRATPVFGPTSGTYARPLLSSPSNNSATTMLADLKLLLPMNTDVRAYLLKWQSGAGSTVKNIVFDRRTTSNLISLTNPAIVSFALPLIQITGPNAGGKWYGLRAIAASNFTLDARYLKVADTRTEQTAQALRFYMLNIEHCEGSPQVEFVNAANFDIYQFKAESYNYSGTKPGYEWVSNDPPRSAQETVSASDCVNFRMFGFGGTASPSGGLTNANIRISGDSNDYLLTQIQFQQQNPLRKDGDQIRDYPNAFQRLIVDNVVKVKGDEQAVLYLKGTPPDQAN